MESYILEYPDTLDSLLERYDGPEKICLLSGKRPKLAFSPSASLSLHWDNIDLKKIKDFCQNNQSKNRLVVGFLSYDLGLYLHNLNPKNKTKFPLVHLYSFDNWLEEHNGRVVVNYRDKKFLEEAKDLASKPKKNSSRLQLRSGFKAGWNIKQYKAVFDKVKNYIKSGDIYQINLSYPLTAVTDSNAKDIFVQTRKTNKVDMAGLFQTPDFDLISLSPETFIRIEDHHIETFPIKGTRAKRNKISDDQIVEDLISDKKERAELSMISDLLRNDLSMVCQPNSVRLKSGQNTTRLSRVIHTYSHITGELSPGISSIESLLKIFPGGSISGCPKKRALEIIDELEDYSRGPYTGSIFTLEPNDNLEASILIRTLIKKDKSLSLPVGGGIVFDSNYQSEYQETLDKSASITQTFAKTLKA